jgi:hypothetical protein
VLRTPRGTPRIDPRPADGRKAANSMGQSAKQSQFASERIGTNVRIGKEL